MRAMILLLRVTEVRRIHAAYAGDRAIRRCRISHGGRKKREKVRDGKLSKSRFVDEGPFGFCR